MSLAVIPMEIGCSACDAEYQAGRRSLSNIWLDGFVAGQLTEEIGLCSEYKSSYAIFTAKSQSKLDRSVSK